MTDPEIAVLRREVERLHPAMRALFWCETRVTEYEHGTRVWAGMVATFMMTGPEGVGFAFAWSISTGNGTVRSFVSVQTLQIATPYEAVREKGPYSRQ